MIPEGKIEARHAQRTGAEMRKNMAETEAVGTRLQFQQKYLRSAMDWQSSASVKFRLRSLKKKI